MNPQLDQVLESANLTPEQRELVLQYVATKTKRYKVNSNRVEHTFALTDGTKLTLGIGKKSGLIRVYGLRNRLPVALSRERWENLFEAAPMIREFIAKNIDGTLPVIEEKPKRRNKK